MIGSLHMKKPADVDDMASRFTEAASMPLTASVTTGQNRPPTKTRKTGSVSVFLRVPSDLYARYDTEAVSRTKATGKGVTVQQIILERMAAP
jgi:hypothetical protein